LARFSHCLANQPGTARSKFKTRVFPRFRYLPVFLQPPGSNDRSTTRTGTQNFPGRGIVPAERSFLCATGRQHTRRTARAKPRAKRFKIKPRWPRTARPETFAAIGCKLDALAMPAATGLPPSGADGLNRGGRFFCAADFAQFPSQRPAPSRTGNAGVSPANLR
jgi:hypothetical protein